MNKYRQTMQNWCLIQHGMSLRPKLHFACIAIGAEWLSYRIRLWVTLRRINPIHNVPFSGMKITSLWKWYGSHPGVIPGSRVIARIHSLCSEICFHFRETASEWRAYTFTYPWRHERHFQIHSGQLCQHQTLPKQKGYEINLFYRDPISHRVPFAGTLQFQTVWKWHSRWKI